MTRRSVKKFAHVVHTCTAELIFLDDDGQRQKEPHRIVYREASPDTMPDSIDSSETEAWLNYLAKSVVDLPDMFEGTEEAPEPVKITLELFKGFSWDNLTAMIKAITEDMNPGKAPSSEQPAG